MVIRRHRRRGVKLIDLMVAVVVVSILLALLPRFVGNARVNGRRAQCMNNLRNSGLALVQFQISKSHFPNAGTFLDDPEIHQGDPKRSSIYEAITNPGSYSAGNNPCLSNWVVDTLPYLDGAEMANAWDRTQPYDSRITSMADQPPNGFISNTAISILRCPDDTSAQSNQGNLSYVVNGGFVRWAAVPIGWDGSAIDGQSKNGPVLQWTPDGCDWRDTIQVNRKLGVMFLGTHKGNALWDVQTTAADITDGAGVTLLLGENTLAGQSAGNVYSGGLATNWACPLPNFCMFLASDDVCRSEFSSTDCLRGQLRPTTQGKTGAGWSLANQAGSPESINFGRSLSVKGSFPFINSGHPHGANVIMCDGSAKFISETIDGKVYAELTTPAGTRLPDALRQSQVGVDGNSP